MSRTRRYVALAVASLALVGVGSGVVAASPSVSAARATGTYKACLTPQHTLTNVTLSPAHSIHCTGDNVAVRWNGKGRRGAHGTAGANGAPGANGSTILSGHGGPPAAAGHPGDFYIDIDALAIYGPKTAGGWPDHGQALRGPQGPQGPPGEGGGGSGNTEVTVVRGSSDGTTLPFEDENFTDVVTASLPAGSSWLVHAKVVVELSGLGSFSTECRLGELGPTETQDEAFASQGPGDNGQAAATLMLTNDYDLTQADSSYTVHLQCVNNNGDGNATDLVARYAVLDITRVDTLNDPDPGFTDGGGA